MHYAVVAFVDVLGFAQMVQKDSRTDHPHFLPTFLAVFSKIREEFGPAIRMFSDSIVVESDLDIDGVIGIISIAKKLQREFLLRGILVRGGIAFGKHFSDEHTIFSEALINAYHLESQKARNPRIVVDHNLLDFFENFPGLPPAVRVELLAHLCRDRDGMRFIGYIDEDNVESVSPIIEEIVKNNIIGSDSVLEKLCWLLDYHSFVCDRVARAELKLKADMLSFSPA